MTIHKWGRACVVIALALTIGVLPACKGEKPVQAGNDAVETTESPQTEQDNSWKIDSNEPDYIISAREKNPDVVGWIKIQNTAIDYPIVITDNNDFYIDNDIDKKPSKSGALFFDMRNIDKAQRRNLIIYGHNMKNGTMFRELSNFKQRDFFENTRRVTLWAWGEERVYEVYAQFTATVTQKAKDTFIQTKFESDKEYSEYISRLRDLSKYKVDVKVDAEDEILTLLTCTYEVEDVDARYAVMAVRIK